MTPRTSGETPQMRISDEVDAIHDDGEYAALASGTGRYTMYAVNDLYASIQGEGVMTGVPMVVLRLQGCPVGCAFCDTKETWTLDPAHETQPTGEPYRGVSPRWQRVPAWALAHDARVVSIAARWVLLTGGEPAEQPLRALVDELHEQGFRVALETSGTATGHLDAGCDHVCISPKIGMKGGRVIQPTALRLAHEIKWVVGKASDLDKLHAFLHDYRAALPNAHGEYRGVQVCLQPMSQHEEATKLCVAAVLPQADWRLSLQTHKYAGLK